MVVTVYDFTNSIAVNTHMAYTDGAYANVGNVVADLSYLGISTIRDSVPNPYGGIPAANQVSALKTLAADGIKFDLLVSPGLPIAQTITQINSIETFGPNSVIAVEGPNEINNNPVSYGGFTGQAGANAYQAALYKAIKANAATANLTVYDYTGGLAAPLVVAGQLTTNANGSYTLVNGQIGFPVMLPVGTSTITLAFTGPGTGDSGLFPYPGQGQVTSITYSSNGTITYQYNNTSGAPRSLYVDFADWGSTQTLTSVVVTGPNSRTNLVTFDPNLSIAGQADDANIHPYPYGNAPIVSAINNNYQNAFGSIAPGPRVITETGYTTDPLVSYGVTQTEQAQQIINGLFDSYQSGVSTTYLYELLDEKADPSNTNSEMHFGLFNFDNSPKPAAIAVHNLTTILSDPGSNAASFQTGTLNYNETGASSSDQSLLMQKSNGVFDLALWNDAAPGTAKSDPMTVAFSQTYQTVVVYDVITNATTKYTNVSSVSLNLGGDATIIEIDPNQSASLGVTAAITASALNEITNMMFLSSSNSSIQTLNAKAVGMAMPAAALGIVHTLPAASSVTNQSGGLFQSLMANHLPLGAAALIASLLGKTQI